MYQAEFIFQINYSFRHIFCQSPATNMYPAFESTIYVQYIMRCVQNTMFLYFQIVIHHLYKLVFIVNWYIFLSINIMCRITLDCHIFFLITSRGKYIFISWLYHLVRGILGINLSDLARYGVYDLPRGLVISIINNKKITDDIFF